MTLLVTKDFDTGPAGASAAADFTSTLGTAPVYHAASAASGAFGVRCVAAGTASRGDTTFGSSTTAWMSFYVTIESTAPINVYIAAWRNGSTAIGDLRVNSGATTLTMRDNTSAISGLTTPALGLGRHRVSIRATPGSSTGHELRVYIGSNRDGSTPDFSASGAATNAGQTIVNSLSLGIITSSTWNLGLDRLRIDDASEPAGTPPTPSILTLRSATTTGTVTGTSALAALADASDGTFVTLTVGQVLDGVLEPMEKPSAEFTATARVSTDNAGTLTARLVHGGTTLATVTGIAPTGTLAATTITFPSTAIDTEVTQSQWRSGLLHLTLTVV